VAVQSAGGCDKPGDAGGVGMRPRMVWVEYIEGTCRFRGRAPNCVRSLCERRNSFGVSSAPWRELEQRGQGRALVDEPEQPALELELEHRVPLSSSSVKIAVPTGAGAKAMEENYGTPLSSGERGLSTV